MKKIDKLVSGSFVGPYLLSFFVAEFVLIMMFLWKYIDEILGKGFTMFDILELLFYYGVTIIPMAVPITILISSVMVYGDMSEKHELASLKSAGVSLFRIMRIFFAATILAVVLFSPSLHAQEEKTKSSFEFSFVTWKNLTVAPVFYRDGDKYHEIDLIRAQRSELYRFKKPQAQMLLYTQGENEEGEIVYKLAGKTAIKAASSRMLFFIQDHVEVGPDQLPLILSGIDDSLDAFPMGSFRFVNSTKLPLQVLFP